MKTFSALIEFLTKLMNSHQMKRFEFNVERLI